MRTYYRGRDAVVTSEIFLRRASSARSFAIHEMYDVRMARIAGNGRIRLLIAAAASVAGLAVASWAWSTGSYPTLFLLALITPGTIAGTLLWQRRPDRWELRALCRGRQVIVFSSADATTFNQVSRALRRAIEDSERLPSFAEDEAA